MFSMLHFVLASSQIGGEDAFYVHQVVKEVKKQCKWRIRLQQQ